MDRSHLNTILAFLVPAGIGFAVWLIQRSINARTARRLETEKDLADERAKGAEERRQTLASEHQAVLSRLTELEKLVVEIESAGREWVEAKLLSDQLEEDAKPFLASIINEADRGDSSEAKLDRQARGSKQYRDFIREMCSARAETLRKKVRYEGLQALFEAKRSEGALERVKIDKGISGYGR